MTLQAEPQLRRDLVRFPYSRHRHGTPSPLAPALQCIDVSVKYAHAARPAIHHITFSVPQGARVALVGPNGAGKSTLLKAAAGLLPVVSGTLRVHGSTPGGCCHRVAYLAQRGELDWRFPMTVRRLVLTGRYVHLGWFAWPRRHDQEMVDRALELMQIADLANRRIGELSGGQQQRVLLARALAQEADMLLLDEPLNAVDAGTRAVVREVLRSLSTQGKTVVAATHDPHDMEREYEQVIPFHEGEINAQGAEHHLSHHHVNAASASSLHVDA